MIHSCISCGMAYGILYFWGVKNRRNNDLAITFSYVKKKIISCDVAFGVFGDG